MFQSADVLGIQIQPVEMRNLKIPWLEREAGSGSEKKKTTKKGGEKKKPNKKQEKSWARNNM